MKLYGNITKIDSTVPLIFRVKNIEDEKIYKCQYNDFLPIRIMDAINGNIELQNPYNIFISKPLVVPVENFDFLKQALYICLRGKGFGYVKCEKFLAELEDENGDITKIFDYLNQCSEGKKKLVSEIISNSQTNKFSIWWKKNYLERRLFLFGLNNKEIKYSYLSLTDLYEKIKLNPFTIQSITLEKAKEIYKLINKTETVNLKKNIIGGKIIRYLNESSWSSIPLSYISKAFPEIHTCLNYIKENFPIVFEDKYVYSQYAFDMENYLANKIVSLLTKSFDDKLRSQNLPKVVNQILIDDDIILNKEQNWALNNCLNDHICVITGGAGCGKTTLIKQIVKNLKYRNEDFILTSFTGKAVLRMKEILGSQYSSNCYTLSLLIKKGFVKFKRLIIDEASMISGSLIYEFLKNYDHNFKIILVGDNNQLPPIGLCSFFKEVIRSEKVPVYQLTENKRIVNQEKSFNILHNANNLISEKFEGFETGKGFEILEGGKIMVYKILKALHFKNVAMEKITVLTPYNKDIDNINKYSSEIFLKDKYCFEYGNRKFILDDRVIQTTNVYSKEIEVMNGEEGVIYSVTPDNLIIKFSDEKIVKYKWNDDKKYNKEDDESSKKELHSYDLKQSFCKTIHKSQGSEYDFVIIYLPFSNNNFVTINMLYTAITRAKKTVWIVSDKNTLFKSSRNKIEYKYDRLAEKIKSI